MNFWLVIEYFENVMGQKIDSWPVDAYENLEDAKKFVESYVKYYSKETEKFEWWQVGQQWIYKKDIGLTLLVERWEVKVSVGESLKEFSVGQNA